MRNRMWVSVLGGACVMTFGGAGWAQSIERLSLGLETGIFSVQTESLTSGGVAGTVVDQSSSGFSLGGRGFGLNLVGGVAPNIALGLEALVSNASVELDGVDADSMQVTLQPRAEYVFGSDAFRPFVAALIGYHASSATSEGVESKSSLFSYGAGIGAHGFIGDSFSIDPLLSFQGLTGSRTFSANGMKAEPDSGGTLIALTIAFSGWFGASPPKESDGVSAEGEGGTAAGAGVAVTALPGGLTEAQAGEAKVTVELPDYHQLMLFARPGSAKAIKLTLIEGSKSSDLNECRELELVAADKKVALQQVTSLGAKTLRMTRHYMAQGFSMPEALAALAAAPDASIRVCDKVWKMSAESQATIRTFLEKYRELGGTFEEAPAAPTAPPAPATDPLATPPEPAAPEPAPTAPPAPSAAPAKAPAAPAKAPAPAAPAKPSPAPAPKPPGTP